MDDRLAVGSLSTLPHSMQAYNAQVTFGGLVSSVRLHLGTLHPGRHSLVAGTGRLWLAGWLAQGLGIGLGIGLRHRV